MGCWGLLGLLLIVSQWIIPSIFFAFSTSKILWDQKSEEMEFDPWFVEKYMETLDEGF